MALGILEHEGADALTMRHLAAAVGMQAPSLYKHFATKRAVEVALIEQGLAELGATLHASVARGAGGGDGAVRRLLSAYRAAARANPALYRLATAGPLPRADLPPGLEDWAGEPFLLATGDPWRAQALFAFAHGMVILELDDRLVPAPDLRSTWGAGARAFAGTTITGSRVELETRAQWPGGDAERSD
ncbi:MAG: helix-turn-helix domain containing protein [Actinomycetota bacterium]|nr:helix-turn-helix domain containing protein [Actinomycetota bacterium]